MENQYVKDRLEKLRFKSENIKNKIYNRKTPQASEISGVGGVSLLW